MMHGHMNVKFSITVFMKCRFIYPSIDSRLYSTYETVGTLNLIQKKLNDLKMKVTLCRKCVCNMSVRPIVARLSTSNKVSGYVKQKNLEPLSQVAEIMKQQNKLCASN